MHIHTERRGNKMTTMAKSKKPKENEENQDFWTINLKLDGSLRDEVEEYQKSPRREYRPSLTQIFERAIRELLRKDKEQEAKEQKN
jgi:hypothetical protein